MVLKQSYVYTLAVQRSETKLLSKENPQLLALEALENTYNRMNTVLFVVAPKDGNVFTRETLGMIEELTEAAWQMRFLFAVREHTETQLRAK